MLIGLLGPSLLKVTRTDQANVRLLLNVTCKVVPKQFIVFLGIKDHQIVL